MDHGKAVIEERTQPQNLAELRNYLRREYGLGTEPGYLRREAAEGDGRPRSLVGRTLRRVVLVLAKAMGARPSGNGRKPRGRSPESTR